MRCLEHVPIVGHVIAACQGCSGRSAEAERAAVNATIGFVLFPVSIVAELSDDLTRERSQKLKQGSRFTSRLDWMRRHRQRALRNICLPGSHQSATYLVHRRLDHSPMAIGWSKCQRADISSQLTAGVRFLDVLVASRDRDVWCISCDDKNRTVALCVRLRDVLTSVKEFVTKNKSEIVVVHLTAGDGDNDGQTFPVDWKDCIAVINDVLGARLIPERMRELPIGDIVDHGRNVIVCGLPEAQFDWQPLQYRIANKPMPGQLDTHMRGTIAEIGLYRPSCIFWYRAECTPNQKVYVRSFGGVFGAVAGRHGGPEKFNSMEHLASCANNVVLRVLNDVTMLPFNVLSTDYVNDKIIGRVIELNERAERGVSIVSPSTTVHGSAVELTDDVFPLSPVHSNVRLMDSTFNNSIVGAARLGGSMTSNNTSFDFRVAPNPPIQVRETTM